MPDKKKADGTNSDLRGPVTNTKRESGSEPFDPATESSADIKNASASGLGAIGGHEENLDSPKPDPSSDY